MKRLIHRGYFREIFSQLRIAGIIMASILMLFNVGPLFTNITARIGSNLAAVPDASSLAVTMMAYIYIASLVLTFIAFNWLNRRSTSDFYHALPIKRSQIYWSTFLAVALWILIAVTGYAIVHAALYLLTGMPFNCLTYLCVYLNMLIGIIQVVGVVSLACALSGTRFVNLFSAVAILLVPRALLMILALFINVNADFLPVTRIFFLFDPSYNIFATPYMVLVGSAVSILGGRILNVDFCCAPAMLYSLVHACLLAYLGCIAFKRRASESAGMPMKSRVLQGAIRTAFGLPLLLLLVLLFLNGITSFYLIVILTLFSFTIYCLYELISTKSAKRMLLAMPLFTICIGIAVLYFFVPKLIGKAAASVKADRDNIASVEFEACTNQYASLLNENQLGVRLDDPKVIRFVADAYSRAVDPNREDTDFRNYVVRIHRKNGRDLLRTLSFSSSELKTVGGIIEQSDAYVRSYSVYPAGIHYYQAQGLSYRESREIGRIFQDEFSSMSEKDRVVLRDLAKRDDLPDGLSRICYVLKFRAVHGTKDSSGSFVITGMTPKTAQRYTELLYKKYNEHTLDHLHDTLTWMETGVYPTAKEGMFTVTDSFPSDMQIGSSVYLDFSSVFYRDGKKLPKDNDPEYYEILKILSEAELTDNAAEGVTVSIGDRIYTDSYDTLVLSGIVNLSIGRNALFNLKLSDEQFARIEELYSRHQTRLEESRNNW